MSARRASLLTALLLTAALLCAMPGLTRIPGGTDANRMNQELRPARARTLTVWLLSDGVEDRKALSELCAAFEKNAPGVRIFMRKVDVTELMNPESVKPDIALYSTGDVVNPEQVFLPLGALEQVAQDAMGAGMSGGMSFAVPLWYAPNVLSLPVQWMLDENAPIPTPTPSSFFALDTPAPSLPPGESKALLSVEELPWRRLLERGAMRTPRGVALQQMLFVCPPQLRGELVAACTAGTEATPAPSAAKLAPTTASVKQWAQVRTLAAHQAAVRAGETLVACPLRPAVSDAVRYLSLCRDSEDARTFLSFLLSKEAQAAALTHGLLPATAQGEAVDPLAASLLSLYQEGLLFPNAFAHTGEELRSLCMSAFIGGEDPVKTLLELR